MPYSVRSPSTTGSTVMGRGWCFSVRHETDELSPAVEDGGRAEARRRHDEKRLLRRAARLDYRIVLPAPHDVLHRQEQAPSQRAPRMEHGEILRGEIACRKKRHGQRVAHGERRRRARRRRKP